MTPNGGADRISTKVKLGAELLVLGRVLTTLRERARLKQSEVAARLGLPASYLSKVENGTRRLDVIEFVRLVEAMGLDAAEAIAELQRELLLLAVEEK
jgi:transcriptional regulator with XRE-family HTH domain